MVMHDLVLVQFAQALEWAGWYPAPALGRADMKGVLALLKGGGIAGPNPNPSAIDF